MVQLHLYFYDSWPDESYLTNCDKENIAKKLCSYLRKAHYMAKETEFDAIQLQFTTEPCPKQAEDTLDCGLFLLLFMEYLERRANFTFSQQDMPYFYDKVLYEIVNEKVSICK